MKLNSLVTKKLYSYQVSHVENLISSLNKHSIVLDASDTGTGKTYSTLAICKALRLRPFIICPKSVISSWSKTANYFNLDILGVVNYELIKNCQYYPPAKKNQDPKERKKTQCPYLVYNNDPTNKLLSSYKYIWKLPKNSLIVFDEAHRCKNYKTGNANLLMCASLVDKQKIILLSATLADKPKFFKVFGFVFQLYSRLNYSAYWLKMLSKRYRCPPMIALNREIFPEYGNRMRISELGKLFPQNQIVAKCYDMDRTSDIEDAYREIEEALEELKQAESHASGLAKLTKARQKVELFKIPTFLEIAKDSLENNLSVAIFVNFTETLVSLAESLATGCLIYGDQTQEERDKNIESFNQNISPIIIANIKAGGVGISLHDVQGGHPRISIISPTWSAQDLIQVLGRIHRAGAKTPSLQRIIYCNGTIEEDICQKVNAKLENLSSLNDGDIGGYKIKGISMTEDALQATRDEIKYNQTAAKPKEYEFETKDDLEAQKTEITEEIKMKKNKQISRIKEVQFQEEQKIDTERRKELTVSYSNITSTETIPKVSIERKQLQKMMKKEKEMKTDSLSVEAVKEILSFQSNSKGRAIRKLVNIVKKDNQSDIIVEPKAKIKSKNKSDKKNNIKPKEKQLVSILKKKNNLSSSNPKIKKKVRIQIPVSHNIPDSKSKPNNYSKLSFSELEKKWLKMKQQSQKIIQKWNF